MSLWSKDSFQEGYKVSYKERFPILQQENIHYLDSAATAQKPLSVIRSIEEYYKSENGNPGRGSHRLSMLSLQRVEECRRKVKEFIGAEKDSEIIFTKNATEGLNLVAHSYAGSFLGEGDEILLAVSNHHANIVPWQESAKKSGATIRYVYLDAQGQLDMEDFRRKLSPKTKLTALSIVVNATGVLQPYREVLSLAARNGSLVLLDAAQSIGHFRHAVRDWRADFLVFSGHKIYSAMGAGILYAKEALLQKMPPFMTGGDMIDEVTEEGTLYADLPHKFEPGTKDAGGIVSLGAAIDFIEDLGYDTVQRHITELRDYALQRLEEIGGVEIYCAGAPNAGIIAFNVRGVHSHDTAYILDSLGVMVRSGHHCTQPLMKYLGIPSCCRASFNIYNEKSDIEALILGITKVKEVFSL